MLIGGCASSKPDAFELLRLIAAIQLASRDDLDISPDNLAKVQDGSLILAMKVVGVVGAAVVVDDVAVSDEHSMLNDPSSDEGANADAGVRR